MTIYIIIFTLFIVGAMLEAGGLKKHQAMWLFAGLATLLAIFVGLRYNTGADWHMYQGIFNSSLLADNDNPYSVEYGYIVLNKIFKSVFDNYYVLQFCSTLFFVLSISRFYKKEAPYLIAALALLISFMLFNILMAQVRQSIAVAIIVLFSNYIFERKLWLFLLGIFIASFFHISAVAALPLYFLYRNYGKILPIVLILIANIFFIYPGLMEKLLLQIAPLLPERLSEKVYIYLASIFADLQRMNTGLHYISLLFLTLILILTTDSIDKKRLFFINSLTVYIIIKAFSNSFFILERLESYYLIYAVVSFTFLFNVKVKNIQIYWTKLVLAAILLFFFYMFPIKDITSKNINTVTNRSDNYAKVPYYNCIYHPQEAIARKDWNQN